MADFGAVLRKTIDGLGENTPEMRAKVYEKARATIDAKLAAATPQPSPAVVERQKQNLEDAIADVESDYAAKSGGTGDGSFEQLLSDPEADSDAAIATETREGVSTGPREARPAAKPARRSRTGLVVALVLLVVLAGAAYAVWENRDAFMTALGLDQVMAPAIEESDEQPATDEVASNGQADEAPVAAEAPAGEVGQVAADGGDASGQTGGTTEKFTQRLMPDGREVDEGPAGGESAIGEGTSVAAATEGPESAATDGSGANAEGVDEAGGEPAADASAEAAVPVGQKAIFYEERTRSAEGSAQEGAVVWSLVEEPPSEGLPPEPVIEGEATIPGKGIQLKLTIRRNADESLPASHIIEMIFLAPDDFEGGGIENVLRIAMKGSEQETGNPLLGIPAKIDSGFFLFALSDTQAEMETNMTLLRRLRWIDISIAYESGRRALIAMEKGIPGEKVFNDALNAWQSGSSG